MDVTEVTPAFREQLIQATRPVVERYGQDVDKELYNSLMQQVNASK